VIAAIARVRASATDSLARSRITDALARCVERWRDRNYARRRAALIRIAHGAGYSPPLLDESIEALLKPFTRAALESMRARLPMKTSSSPLAIGFILAGNVVGAGFHEITIALIAGSGLVLKTASAEPVFFEEFARTLAEIDPAVGSRVAVLTWSRTRDDLTAAMTANCDRVVVYGDDATVASIGPRAKLFSFGSRVSGAAVAPSALESGHLDALAEALARDVSLFEQLGCLSPHHIFVLTTNTAVARDFATRLACALERLATAMPRAGIPLRDAAAIVSVRENARWRAIAGEPIELLEGLRLGWTVVLHNAASFSVSPGFRTVTVSAVRDFDELRERLSPAAGRLEAIAFAGNESERRELAQFAAGFGVSYISPPGEIQSPPLDWRHGGGAFLDSMVSPR
jgi:Acyl-CoA reductase (LuxC)